jgi:hypothetical protein
MERVVRRFFLLGTDSVRGKNYDHRIVWTEEQLNRLAYTTEPQRVTEKFLRFSKFVPFGSLLCVSVVRVVVRIDAGAGVGTAGIDAAIFGVQVREFGKLQWFLGVPRVTVVKKLWQFRTSEVICSLSSYQS